MVAEPAVGAVRIHAPAAQSAASQAIARSASERTAFEFTRGAPIGDAVGLARAPPTTAARPHTWLAKCEARPQERALHPLTGEMSQMATAAEPAAPAVIWFNPVENSAPSESFCAETIAITKSGLEGPLPD